ncbi:MgtC/SapB family protein [Sediminivirga luteola]|uniref:Membrane protein n=1 Tax=Sediminivirga luteola TaxID=1774748 RepID=A0A8J2TVM8_9MICO|nr:MgtC/SapB family protein [Sediminivirga luteola]GGA04972.1 membrane protein [Sediminivirga luteola]
MNITFWPESAPTEAVLLLCAFVLSAVIGVEREIRHKSAGARTHILVGLGSALFTLVSAYGFAEVLGSDVMLDPSRIAAQIVTGIGFLGAGVIFVRRNSVAGLTTAASIWVTAAVGMACGAGMPFAAVLTVLLYLSAVTVVNLIVRHLPTVRGSAVYAVRYEDGRGVLRDLLQRASELGYQASLSRARRRTERDGTGVVETTLRFSRRQSAPVQEELMQLLTEHDGVVHVQALQDDHD